MKNLMKNLLIVGAVLVALMAGMQAAGPVGALLAAGATYSAVQYAGLVEIPTASFWTLTSFANLSRRARQLDNLGGLVEILILSEEDLTDNWPKKADVMAGVVTAPPPLVTAKSFAKMVFDTDSGMIKISRKGELGYQNHSLEGGAKLAGVSKEQFAALGLTANCGAVLICKDQEGRRWIAGTKYRPCTLEYDANWGGKADDKKQIDIKFKGDGYSFAMPELDAAAVIPTLV